MCEHCRAPKRGSVRPLLLVAFQTQTQNRSVLATQFPKIASLPPVVDLKRKSQLATLRLGTQFPKSRWPLSFSATTFQIATSSRRKSNATKSQMLAFHKSQRFSATKPLLLNLGLFWPLGGEFSKTEVREVSRSAIAGICGNIV